MDDWRVCSPFKKKKKKKILVFFQDLEIPIREKSSPKITNIKNRTYGHRTFWKIRKEERKERKREREKEKEKEKERSD